MREILSQLQTAVCAALTFLLSLLPLPLMLLFGTLLGEIAFYCASSRRAITIKNLKTCFPHLDDRAIRTLARKHFHHIATLLFTSALAWWAPQSRILRLCAVSDKKMMARIISGEEKLILLCPHFTNLEFTGAFFFCQRYMTSIYQRHKTPAINRLIFKRRTRFGSTFFDKNNISPSMIKSIRKGIPFYYLPDQDPGRKNSVFAPFYGIPTATYSVLSRITRLGQAKVIPCMIRLKPWGSGFELLFGAPIENFPSGSAIQDATMMNHHIEMLIENAPEQYFWSHRRFKTRPQGDPPFY